MKSVDLSNQEIEGMMNFSEGICINCKETTCGAVEPDAEGYVCESCGANEVYGIDQAILLGYVNVVEGESEPPKVVEDAKRLLNDLNSHYYRDKLTK